MAEVIIDLHNIATEYLIYVIIAASGFVVRHFIMQLKAMCSQIDQLEKDSDNIKKALVHLADFEYDMMHRLHPDICNGQRNLKEELKNILE